MTTEVSARSGLSERAQKEVLHPDALAFVRELHERFAPAREDVLAARRERDRERQSGAMLDFLEQTRSVRESSWSVASPPVDYRDRRVEITGPTDRKLVINAMNSGARGFMADCEDATSPTWRNVVEGQVNLVDAVRGDIDYTSADGRDYRLGDEPATLLVRPRGWHLPERHMTFGTAASGALVDFGLFAFHNAKQLVATGRGVFFYLPKLEHHLEARLWNEVLSFSEDALDIPRGSMRATVLIETLPAAFQMDEILWELRDHSLGLNAGRWDYIFSAIKCFREDPRFVTPDRSAITMTVPFMKAYTERLVATCHSRGAFAMGGMAALIPSRTDDATNERALAAVRADKHREAWMGFDGTWVAHPDVVEAAMREFDAVLTDEDNQIGRALVTKGGARELLDVAATPGKITREGVRSNVSVGFRYISFWLNGRGAAAINGMMEDAATAEICRAQIWQWIRHGWVGVEEVRQILDEEMQRIHDDVGDDVWQRGRPDETRRVFERVTLEEDFVEFLTLPAYEVLEP
jgi:malate synthase